MKKIFWGETPLTIAQMYQHDELAMLLLSRKQVKFNK